MNNNKVFILLMCGLFLPIILTACIKQREQSQPLSGGLPDQEIVFMPYDPHYFHGRTKNTIGFVDREGKNLSLKNFNVAGVSAEEYPKNYSTYVIGPRWSKDGESIVFTIADGPPNIRLIDKQGYMYGSACKLLDQAGGFLDFDLKGNILMWLSEIDVTSEYYEDKLSEDESLIVKYDLKSCQIIEYLHIPFPSKYWVTGVNISDGNVLAAMLFDSTKKQFDQTENPYLVLIYNLQTDDVETFPGYHPSISNDGELLAYFGYDGSIRVRDLETKEEFVLQYLFEYENAYQFVSRPGWSPDRKWIVYNNREGEIYRANLETGEIIYITKGFAPDWR